MGRFDSLHQTFICYHDKNDGKLASATGGRASPSTQIASLKGRITLHEVRAYHVQPMFFTSLKTGSAYKARERLRPVAHSWA